MKIKNKLILFYTFIFSISIVIVLLISKYALINGFENIEEKNFQENISRFNELILSEQRSLHNSTVSWSTWDETYNYLTNRNKKYLRDNFLTESYFDNKIDHVFLLNKDKKIIFSQGYNYNDQLFLAQDEELNKFILDELKKAETNSNGLFSFKNKIYLYTINPILPSTSTQNVNSNGFFVALREINQEMIMNFQTKMSYKIRPIFNNNISNKKNETVATYYNIASTNNSSNIVFELKFERSIYTYGQKVLLILSVTLTLLSFLIILFINFVINKLITNKILKITKELENNSNTNDNKNLITTFSNDEIGTLSNQINLTLLQIQNNQKLLIQNAKLISLGEMAGSIAHEINNPLTVIKSYAQKTIKDLKNNKVDPNLIEKNLLKIESSSERIIKIINSLKLISHTGENDHLKIASSNDILNEIHNLFKENLKHSDIDLITSNFNGNLILEINYVKFLQVFVNLINNAIDAIHTSSNKWIKIEAYQMDQKVIFKIINSGDKISQDVQEKIFEPFFTTKQIGAGTGLGLSISRKTIENHNGRIYLNQEDSNTCFVIEMPLYESKIHKEAG